MLFLNLLGALAFVSLLFVIALYLLKRHSKETPVSSLLLWRKALNEASASRPFQKLRKALLLILQLLMCALLSLALMQPILPGKTAVERVLVFDLSASMQAQTEGKSRLELAVRDAKALVSSLPAGTKVTVLLAGSEVTAPVSRSDDPARVLSALNGIRPENGTVKLAQAVSLAKAMAGEAQSADVIVYSDDMETTEGVSVRNMGDNAANTAVSILTLTPGAQGVTAYASLTNYGPETAVTMELYADDVLFDARNITLAPNGDEGVQVTLPTQTTQARAVIVEGGGAIKTDDERFACLTGEQNRRVLLVSKGNVFLEKALTLRDDVTLLKTSPDDYSSMIEADLTVLDGFVPSELPAGSSILAIAPDKEIAGITPEQEKQGVASARLSALPLHENLTSSLVLDALSISAYHPLTGGEAVLSFNGDTVLSISQTEKGRAAALGFDIHQSNLPLKADFPVLIQNLLTWLVPDAVSLSGGECGQEVTITAGAAVEKTVITPAKRELKLSSSVLDDTNEQGIYTLITKSASGEETKTPFTLHMAASESNVQNVLPGSESGNETAFTDNAGKSLIPALLLCLLALLLIEWGVSRRGA